MKIAVDVMSGDHEPEILVQGAVEAANELNVHIVLVGNRKIIESALTKQKLLKENLLEIEDSSEVILMTDEPVEAFRQKKDSSVVKAANLVKAGAVDAFLSPGNTGATFIASLMINGRIKGVDRPAIATFLPTLNKEPLILLDAGANLDCKVINYIQYAVMGEVFIERYFNKSKPKIAILNVGTEKSKGPDILKKTYKTIDKMNLNFIGNIEAKHVLDGKVNVIITDGFSGNLFLKSLEGTFKSIIHILKNEINKSVISKTGALLMKPAFNSLKKMVAAEEFGAAPLLGINGAAMVAHGDSQAQDIKSGIRMTANLVKAKIHDGIVDGLAKYKVGRLHFPVWHLKE